MRLGDIKIPYMRIAFGMMAVRATGEFGGHELAPEYQYSSTMMMEFGANFRLNDSLVAGFAANAGNTLFTSGEFLSWFLHGGVHLSYTWGGLHR